MAGTQKEQAINSTATELRQSISQVRTVVETYERWRSTYRRDRKKPKALGGGWYLMPDGSKVQGKAAAGLE